MLALTRYIHLNPLHAGLVKSLAELNRYRWSGHAAIMGLIASDRQDTELVLSCFGPRRKDAISAYEVFVSEGIAQGRRPELTGGGIVRSSGAEVARYLGLSTTAVNRPAREEVIAGSEGCSQ